MTTCTAKLYSVLKLLLIVDEFYILLWIVSKKQATYCNLFTIKHIFVYKGVLLVELFVITLNLLLLIATNFSNAEINNEWIEMNIIFKLFWVFTQHPFSKKFWIKMCCCKLLRVKRMKLICKPGSMDEMARMGLLNNFVGTDLVTV